MGRYLKSLGASASTINFKMATSIKKDVLNKQDYHSGFVKGGKHCSHQGILAAKAYQALGTCQA